MTKKELFEALVNVPDDENILFLVHDRYENVNYAPIVVAESICKKAHIHVYMGLGVNSKKELGYPKITYRKI